jgi:hypothetical protein
MFTRRTPITVTAHVGRVRLTARPLTELVEVFTIAANPRRPVVYCDFNGTAWSSSHHFA